MYISLIMLVDVGNYQYKSKGGSWQDLIVEIPGVDQPQPFKRSAVLDVRIFILITAFDLGLFIMCMHM